MHLQGDDYAALRWYLHTTACWRRAVGTGDERTRASAKRVAALWPRARCDATDADKQSVRFMLD
ncbi:hypothetical protein [Streptomyces iconiensis]|uniref:Uncharacterized protein n=1 Tax=Streptomyces iconiensis TaxID=1384038 RepID=A0ABT7A4B4_9ACTN|nr:hypothetical protein [Streptomyces iconiensis]MDJ1135463.1 hypothetical protein [Streptomyces iconiensis]